MFDETLIWIGENVANDGEHFTDGLEYIGRGAPTAIGSGMKGGSLNRSVEKVEEV